MKKHIPEIIGGAKTLLYIELDQRHIKTGNTRHIVNGKTAEGISGLAICQYDNEEGIYLFGCDEGWNTITDTWHNSVEEAKKQAEFEYANTATTWQTP